MEALEKMVNFILQMFRKNNVAQVETPKTAPVNTPAPVVAPAPAKQEKTMKVSNTGLTLIKSFEGLKLQSYADPASPRGRAPKGTPIEELRKLSGAPWTIGYGTTGSDIVEGMTWTQEQAEARLASHVQEFADAIVRLVKVKLTQNEFDALVCFVYNVGVGAFSQSTMLKLLNAGDKKAASLQFLRWNRAGGAVMAGLTRRREAEQNLFNS